MEEILAVADLFLLTSEYESFGLASLSKRWPRASPSSLPMPAASRDRHPGRNRVLRMTSGDIRAMSEHAIQILGDEATLKRFKANALAHAKNFDIHRIVPQYGEALCNHFLTTGAHALSPPKKFFL